MGGLDIGRARGRKGASESEGDGMKAVICDALLRALPRAHIFLSHPCGAVGAAGRRAVVRAGRKLPLHVWPVGGRAGVCSPGRRLGFGGAGEGKNGMEDGEGGSIVDLSMAWAGNLSIDSMVDL